jgi:hypothetical protein
METEVINLQLKTNSGDVQKQFTKLRDAIKETTQEIDELTKEFGDNSDEVKAATDRLHGLQSAYEGLSQSATDLGAKFEDVYGEMQPLTARMGEAEDRLYELSLAGKTATKEYQDLLAEVSRYRQAQIQTDMVVDAAATTMAQKLGGALGGAASGFELVQGVMGTFGAESEEVEKVLLKVQSAMAISQGIQGIKEAIPAITAFGTAIKTQAITALSTLKGALITTGIGALVIALGFAANAMGMFSDGSEDAEAAQKKLDDQLEKTNQSLEQQRNFFDKLSVAMEESTRRQVLAAKQRGATEKEITAITAQGIERRIQLLKIEEEQARKTFLQKSKDRNASAKEFEAADKAYQDAINRTNALQLQLDEQRQAEKEAQDQANKDRAKAAKEKRNEELAQLKQFNQEAKDIFLTEEEREIKAIQNGYAEKIALAKKYKQSTENLELAQMNEINDIRKKYQDQQYEIDKQLREKKLQEEKEAMQKRIDLEDAQFQKLQELTLSESDYKILQLQQQYDTEIALAENNVELQTALTQKLQDDIAAINKEAAEKQKELDDKAAEDAKKTHQEKVDRIMDYASTFTDAMSGLNDVLNAADEERLKNAEGNAALEEAIKKRMFERDKKLRIVQTIVDTASNVINSVRNNGGVPAGIPFGIAAGAMGAMQIAAISKTKYEGGGSTGVNDVSAGLSGGQMAPSFNVVGNSGVNQLAALQQQPIQAYVVSGQMTTAQELDRNRIKAATW